MFAVQSKEEVFPHHEIAETFGKESSPDMNRFSVNFGEPVRSLRTLLQRYALNEVWVADSDTSSTVRVDRHVMTRFPVPWGYDPNGASAATSLAATGTKNFSGTKNHVYNLIAPAFAAVRGSFNWNFVVLNESAGLNGSRSVVVKRVPATTANSDTSQVTGIGTIKATPLSAATGAWGAQTGFWNQPCRSWWTYSKGSTTTGPQNDVCSALTILNNTTSGAAAAISGITGNVSVTMPHYNNTLFDPTAPMYSSVTEESVFLTGDELHQLDIISWPSQGQTTRCLRIEKWAGAGADLSLTFFINTPMYFTYNTQPTVVNTAV